MCIYFFLSILNNPKLIFMWFLFSVSLITKLICLKFLKHILKVSKLLVMSRNVAETVQSCFYIEICEFILEVNRSGYFLKLEKKKKQPETLTGKTTGSSYLKVMHSECFISDTSMGDSIMLLHYAWHCKEICVSSGTVPLFCWSSCFRFSLKFYVSFLSRSAITDHMGVVVCGPKSRRKKRWNWTLRKCERLLWLKTKT